MIRSFLLLIGMAYACMAPAQNMDKGIFVDPATVDFNLMNGQTNTATVKIINQMDVKKQFKVYLNDWERDTTGRHRYVEPGTLSKSCSNWITLDKTFVELNPGEATDITVKLQVPDSATAVSSMRWSMLFIETIEEKKAPAKVEGVVTSIHTSYRIGVHIYQTPPSRAAKEIQMLRFDAKANTQDSVYRIECKNVGQAQVHCKSFMELMNTGNGKKYKLTPIEFPLFPEQVRYIDFVLPDQLEKGKYTVTAVVDAGEDVPLEAAEKIIEIK